MLTNELVAIKILDKIILNNTPDDYQSVKQEINILKKMKHKHIVQLYDVLQTSRHIFIIMEYCEGKDLLDYILTKSKLSEEESLKYFQQLINALFYLHSQNIAHRDIKIDNMLLDRNRDLKLVDFGLSTKYPDDNLLNQPCGTVVYAAPEILQGREYHGMLADVWSSGIVLYGMLSGYLPFGDQDDDINRENIIKGKMIIPDYFSDCVKDLLMHMLDLDPMTRYTLQEIRNHPWFNLNNYKLIPGIIIGYNIIPVDEKILNLCVSYNCDKEKVRQSVINNKYNSYSALYYLLVKNMEKEGYNSISDFFCDEFINFILDDNNLVENSQRNIYLNKNQESDIKYNININRNKNSSAPPDGKLQFNEDKNREKEKEANNNNNIITPNNSQDQNIAKKINFDEASNGILSFIINTPSFNETNKKIFNLKSPNSINNKNTNNTNNIDYESKKTNKNTSSNSRQKDLILQTVNDFHIIDDNKEINDKKVINISELKNQNNTSNILIDENYENENDYKILNIIYNSTENNEKSLTEKENGGILNNDLYEKNTDINEMNILNLSRNHNISIFKNKEKNSIEIFNENSNEMDARHNVNILETPIISSTKPDASEDNNLILKAIDVDKKKDNEIITN